MRILVSACLLGTCCKYNGGHNRNEAVLRCLEGHEVVPVCPEQLGGLSTPRVPSEIREGRVVNRLGEDVDAFFRAGVERVLALVAEKPVDLAILQSRSPSCGVRQVYDGTFTGTLKSGQGVLAQALAARGVPLMDAAEVPASGLLNVHEDHVIPNFTDILPGNG